MQGNINRDRAANSITVLNKALTIRVMREDDLDEVHAIEKKSFADPWSKHSMMTALNGNDHNFCIVGVMDGKIIGYAFTWLILDEMHIGNIAVHERYRHRGIGMKLMKYLLNAAYSHGCIMCRLEVRRSNIPAQRLYEKLGFTQTGVHKEYYRNNREDSLIFIMYL